MWLHVHVYEDVSELSKSEQLALFEALKQDLFPEEPDKIDKLLKSIREARFSSGSGGYIHPSSLLCTDTATNYKKFARIKGLQHETINERLKQRVKRYLSYPTR